MKIKFSRSAAAAGVLALASAGLLATAGTANAALVHTPVGTSPGQLTFTPASGNAGDTPGWATSSACPSGFQSNAALFIVTDNAGIQQVSDPMSPLDGITNPSGFTGSNLFANIDALPGLAGSTATFPNTWEFVVGCQNASLAWTYAQSDFVTFNAAGNWTTSATPPAAAPAPTITVSTSPSGSVASGAAVSLTADFDSTSQATGTGTVQFVYSTDGTTWNNIGSAQTKTAGNDVTLSGVTTLPTGTLQIAAVFTSGDTNAFQSTNTESSPVTLLVLGGSSESLSTDVPNVQGAFTYTLSTSSVDLGVAHKANHGDHSPFTAHANLGQITVSDLRYQSHDGWTLQGKASAFTKGSTTVHDGLGWEPTVVSSDHGGATAGAAVYPVTAANDAADGEVWPAGAGIEAAAHNLATAPADATSLDNSVLDAKLDLAFPYNTPNGHYVATIDITSTPVNGSGAL